MVPWVEAPSLTLDWGLPPRLRFACIPADAIERGRVLLDAIRQEAPPAGRTLTRLAPLAQLVRLRTRGRFHDEAVALAAVIQIDWKEIMLGNIAYDLALATFGCSTIALATPSGPVLARNMDWWPQHALARASTLIRAERDGGLAFANAGWPGVIGAVSGLSGRGFGLVLNAVPAPGGIDRFGYPVLLYLRRVLEEATGFDDAVARLTSQRLVAGCLLTVVGTENHQRAVIERTPRRYAIRRPAGDEPILATNHYRALYEKPPGAGSTCQLWCPRYEALHAFFADHRGGTDVCDAELLYALTDDGVCQEITAQHVIIRPRDGEIRLVVPRRLIETPAPGFYARRAT